jgi:hypothetical protein
MRKALCSFIRNAGLASLAFFVFTRPLIPDPTAGFPTNLFLTMLPLLSGLCLTATVYLENRGQYTIFLNVLGRDPVDDSQVSKKLYTVPGFPLALLTAGLLLAAWRAPDPEAAIESAVRWLGALGGFVVCACLLDGRQARLVLTLFLASVLSVGLIGAYQATGGLDLIQEETRQIRDPEKLLIPPGASAAQKEEFRSLFYSRLDTDEIFSTLYPFYPNALAGFLLLTIPVHAGWWLACRNNLSLQGRLLHVWAILLQAFCLYRTGSKGAWLCAAIGLGVWWWLGAPKRRWPGLLALGLAGAVSLFPPVSESRSALFRKGYWAGAWGMIREHPVAGVGLGQFAHFYNRYRLPEGRDVRHAHNDYLELWAEGGLLVLIPWLLLLGTSLGFGSPGKRPARSGFTLRGEGHGGPEQESASEKRLEGVSRMSESEPLAQGALIILIPAGLAMAYFGNFYVKSNFEKLEFLLWITLTLCSTVFFYAASPHPGPLPPEGRGSSKGWFCRGMGTGLAAFLLHAGIDFDLQVAGTLQSFAIVCGLGWTITRNAECGMPNAKWDQKQRGAALAALAGFAVAIVPMLGLGDALPPLEPETVRLTPTCVYEQTERFLRQNPWRTNLHFEAFELAYALWERTGEEHWLDRAERHLRVGLERQPAVTHWHQAVTHLYLERTRRDPRRIPEALVHMENWCRQTPTLPQAYFQLGNFLVWILRDEKRIALYAGARGLEPGEASGQIRSRLSELSVKTLTLHRLTPHVRHKLSKEQVREIRALWPLSPEPAGSDRAPPAPAPGESRR